MRRALIMLALVVGAVGGAVGFRAAPSSASAAKRPLEILVLAGQSNALGFESFVVDPRTHLDVFTEAGRSPADRQSLLMWDETGVPGSGPTPVALDTLQFRSGASTPVFGPEIGLARGLYVAGHRHLLIVKVATDGSSLARDWLPGEDDYRRLLSSVASAERWSRTAGWAPVVSALYWYQGETDAMNAAWAENYAANLKTLLASARIHLGLGTSRPVVITQTDLSDFIRFERAHGWCGSPSCANEWAWNAEVMGAQASLVGRSTFLARTSELPRYGNFIHLSDAGELSLGKTYATLTESRMP